MYLLLIFFVVLLSITEVYEKLIPEIYFNNLVMAYSPLGKPDSPWAMEDEPKLLEDPKLVEIGKKYNKTPAQICLKWQIQRGVAVVPRSVNPSRIAQNADVRIPVKLYTFYWCSSQHFSMSEVSINLSAYSPRTFQKVVLK